jgi:predicted ribosomally synthesized peptide with SipW-like signal peptide
MLSTLYRSVLVLLVVGGAVLGLTNAFFSDTEASTDNVFQAGAIDLKINGQDNPVGIVNFNDLKPGDEKYFDKTIRVDSNPAWVWMHLKGLETTQGTQTEPEDAEENGTPKHDLENFLKYDLSVNNSPIISLDNNVLFPEAYSCWIPLGEIAGGVDVPMVQSFHFDPTVTNWAQGDTLSFTEEFYATQVRNNPSPTPPDTGTGRVWNPETKKCEPGETACVVRFADAVETSSIGTRKNNTAVLASRNDPTKALVAQTLGNAFDNPVVEGTFFSLGFNIGQPLAGGSLVVRFDTPVVNGAGDDLKIYEVTGGPPYPDEKIKVEASPDNSNWTLLNASQIKDGTFDLGVLPSAKYVRITDVSDINIFESTADGYDVDGVQALCAPPDIAVDN